MRPALLVIAAFAVVTTLLAWSRWLAGRRWAAAGHLALAVLAATAAALSLPVVAYVKQHESLVPGLPVAELAFEQIGPDRYRITVTRLPSGRMQVVDATGREWRLALQSLRWAGWTAPFGPQAAYRIAALEASPSPAGVPAPTIHALASPAGREPWLAGVGRTRGQPLLATAPVSGAWMPMGDGLRYEVLLSVEGRVAALPRGTSSGSATQPSDE